MRDYPVIVTVGTLERDALAAVRARGQTYFAVSVLLTILVATGCTVGILLLARNERSSHRLREQASLLDKAQDAILVTDLERRLTFWNKGAERVYGWTAEEAIGRSITDLFYPDGDAREVQQAFQDVMKNSEWTGELQPHTKAGRRVTIESRWTLVRDGAGEARSILSINTDVTDRRHLEQQFYRAQRLESIGTLAGGIAPAVIDKIFDPFFTTKDAGKGTGLGLSTSQTIVRSHGGHIEVTSEANRGTRFAIYLPVAPRTLDLAAAGEDAPPPRGSGQTILVVDDEPSVRLVLRTALERAGYRVLPASNGREAIDVWTRGGRLAMSGEWVSIFTQNSPLTSDIYTVRRRPPTDNR